MSTNNCEMETAHQAELQQLLQAHHRGANAPTQEQMASKLAQLEAEAEGQPRVSAYSPDSTTPIQKEETMNFLKPETKETTVPVTEQAPAAPVQPSAPVVEETVIGYRPEELAQVELPDSHEEVVEGDPLAHMEQIVALPLVSTEPVATATRIATAEETPVPTTQANTAVETQTLDNIRQDVAREVAAVSAPVEEQAPSMNQADNRLKEPESDLDGDTRKADAKEKEEFIPVQELVGDSIGVGKTIVKNTTSGIEDVVDFFKTSDISAPECSTSFNVMELSGFISHCLAPQSTKQVVLLQSAYVAQMSELNFADRDAMTNSSADGVNSVKKRLRIIYNKIAESSLGKMTFDEFLKLTANSEVDILQYGIYAQTFPERNEFDVSCGHCGATTKVSILPHQLVAMVNREANFARIQDILRQQVTSPMEQMRNSMISRKERVRLEESCIIAEVITPSCYDYLEHLSKYNPNTMQDDEETYGVMLFLGRMWVPSIEASRRAHKPIYQELSSGAFNDKFNIVRQLSSRDGSQLVRHINKREQLYAVQHRLTGVICQSCKQGLENIPIDVQQLLFFLLRKQTRQDDAS